VQNGYLLSTFMLQAEQSQPGSGWAGIDEKEEAVAGVEVVEKPAAGY